MPDLMTKKQRLQTLENKIRVGILQGAETFYYVGMDLKEIRDDELYKEEGFPSWNKYLESGRLEVRRSQAYQLIQSAEYRHTIGISRSSGKQENGWSHSAFTELTRVPLEHAARVARKAEALAEKTGKKLSGSFVRGIVDHELDRGPRQPKPQPKPQPSAPDDDDDDDGDGNVHRYLDKCTGQIEGMRRALEDVPQAGWTLLCRDRKKEIKLLIISSRRLADFLEEKR